MKLYRYTDLKTARLILKGSVKLGTLNEYRSLDSNGHLSKSALTRKPSNVNTIRELNDPHSSEKETGGLVDIKEGYLDTILDRPDLRNTQSTENLKRIGLNINPNSPPSNLVIQDNLIRIKYPNRWMTSFAGEYSLEDHKYWLEKEGYDCCLQITDAAEYIKAIQPEFTKEWNRRYLGDWKHQKMELSWKVIRVSYDWKEEDFCKSTLQVNPTRKRPEYSWQKEWRLIIEPINFSEYEPSESMIFESKESKKFCKIIRRL